MSTIKFLLDEHVNPRFRKALVRRESEMIVRCIGDVGVPPLQTSDPDILLWCEAHGFSLVTNNRASMPVHLQDHLAAGRHIPGIFVLNPNMTMGETIDELILIWAASDSDEYVDQLRYLLVSS
jgi:hypothetical protein